MSTETIDVGGPTRDLSARLRNVPANAYVKKPRGYLHRGRHRAPSRLARLARIAFVSLLGTVVLGYGTVGFILTVIPGAVR